MQVFVNLLTNAAKYTPRGGTISTAVFVEGNEAIVRVRDNGAGIAAEDMVRIFDTFTQVHPALTESRMGLGLGLSLVRNLVTLHGGSVQAVSEGAGNGSEFTVRLPLAEDNRRTRAGGAATPVR
ncbi:MAG: ATP-binding protein [Cyanobacteria bacterium]|nr:ATP-binding protein [Cyanobacteriota bacterium]